MALSALGSAVSAGVGFGFDKLGGAGLTGIKAVDVGIKAAAVSVAQQGVNIVLGQQKGFEWRSVAAAGLSAAASSAVSGFIADGLSNGEPDTLSKGGWEQTLAKLVVVSRPAWWSKSSKPARSTGPKSPAQAPAPCSRADQGICEQ